MVALPESGSHRQGIGGSKSSWWVLIAGHDRTGGSIYLHRWGMSGQKERDLQYLCQVYSGGVISPRCVP